MKNVIYSRRPHSVCNLTYHAVFVTKYRRKVMDEEILVFVREYTRYLIEERYHGKLIELNGEPDHIHILFESPPSMALSTIMCNLKTQLSKEIRRRYWDRVKKRLWKDSFWSDSYFLSTTGGADIATLEHYIQRQGSSGRDGKK